MSGLRKAMKSATEDGVPLNDALSTLQDTILNGTDNMDGLSAAYELFGRNGDAVYEAIQNGSLSFEDLANAVADAGGSVSDTYQNTLDPMDQMQQVMNSLAVAGSELMVAVGPLLADALTALTGVIKDATTWWRGLDEGTQKTILTIVGIVAVVGPVLGVLGSLITTVASVSAAVTAAGGVMALITGPVGIAVAAITGLIAAGVAIVTNWDSIKEAAVGFRDSMSETWGNIKEAVGGKIDELKSSASSKWENIKSTTQGAVDGIKSGVTDKFEDVKTGVTGKIDSIKTSMTNKWNSIKSTTVNTITEIQSSVASKFDAIKSGIEEKINDAKDAVGNAIDQIKGFFDFSWSLPHLKLPHPYINGTFSLNPPSVPSFGINWYDKATNMPYLFKDATLFGAGEKHDEVLYGKDALMKDIKKASGGSTVINMTVNGAENPEIWARRFIREYKLQVRTNG
jgi:phage-related minor tail protein